MKNMGIVLGDQAQSIPVVVGKDTVYVHTNIQQINNEDGTEHWQYNEVQYELSEYIGLMSKQNKDLLQQITDTQLALCEIYEGMVQ